MSGTSSSPAALKRFVYPFLKEDRSDPQTPKAVEVVDGQDYYDALATASDGFFPIGNNGQWHGGIHFDSASGGILRQDNGIRCIADGEVIAYRVDECYPTVRYSCGEATYSTGFVLVRHRLQLPAAPASTPADSASGEAAAAPAEAPAAEQDAGAGTAADDSTAAPATESLVFYSLYMHVKHWDDYSKDAKLARPDFWSNTANKQQVGDKATDADPMLQAKGLNVRKSGSGSARIGWLEPGAQITVATGTGAWRKVVSVDSGRMRPDATDQADQDAPLGHVYISELEKVDDTHYTVGGKARDVNPYPSDEEKTRKGVNVRQGNGSKTPLLGWLPPGTQVTLSEGSGNWRKIESVDSGRMTPNPGVQARPDAALGWVYVKELNELPNAPAARDTVYVLPAPVEIKAGELIGYLGEYRRYADTHPLGTCTESRPLFHLEVFAGAEFPVFLAQSRARAAQLDAKHKSLLKIEPGAKQVQAGAPDVQLTAAEGFIEASDSPKAGPWAKVKRGRFATVARSELGAYSSATRMYGTDRVLHRAVDTAGSKEITVEAYNALNAQQKADYPNRKVLVLEGEPIWVERTLVGGERISTHAQASGWSAFPLQLSNAQDPAAAHERVTPIKPLTCIQEGDGTRWWEVEIDTSDSVRTGWVREKDHPNVTLCSPWAWPGFELVLPDTATPVDLYSRKVAEQRTARPEELAQFESEGQRAECGPLFLKLFEKIDSDGDRKLTARELRVALRTPWQAQALSRLIVEHDNEWGVPLAQWNTIDDKIPDADRPDWEMEKQRIARLRWWESVAGQHGFPALFRVHHIHPVGLIRNYWFESVCCQLDMNLFKSIFGDRKIFNHRNMPRDGDTYNADVQRFIDLLNEGFSRYGFDKCIYKHHFLSQCYHESDHFNTTVEYADGWDYDLSSYPSSVCDVGSQNYTKRKCRRRNQIIAEGNTEIGDGPKYKGKGIIQLTWKGTYQSYKKYSGVDVVSHPERVAGNLAITVDTAFWFWTKFKGESLNRKIDRYYERGESSGLSGNALDDYVVKELTKIINGGDRGLSERQELFRKIREKMHE